MKSVMTAELRRIEGSQCGAVTRWQAMRAGLTPDKIKFRVRSGRWQCIYPGVYLTFSGKPRRAALVWAAVLHAGRGAVLSHETAAELHGLTDKKADVVHISIPPERRIASVPGVRIHRAARAGIRYPARTTVEDTVLDLVDTAEAFDDVCALVTRAFARRLTYPALLRKAIASRSRLQWKADLYELINAAVAGDESVLEFRYSRDVERAHGLPDSRRQVRDIGPDGRRRVRRDRVYPEFRVIVELDGNLSHPPESKWRDAERDNAATAAGHHTLRYGWTHVRHRACVTAAEVAQTLREHGWAGLPRPCSAGCPVGRHSEAVS